MTRSTAASLTLLALACLLSACHDTRRSAVVEFVTANPPVNFELVAIDDNFHFVRESDDVVTTVVSARYRLTTPTFTFHDGLSNPEGRKIRARASAVRQWALANLPPDHAVRKAITEESPPVELQVKRVEEPAGTEEEAMVTLRLRREGEAWKIEEVENTASYRGTPEAADGVLIENSELHASALRQLAEIVGGLEGLKENYLAERRRAAERSLEILRARLKTGRTFEGELKQPDAPPQAIRLIISRGLDQDQTVSGVFTDRNSPQSSARFVGQLVQLPSGEYAWSAVLGETLSAPEGTRFFTSKPRRPSIRLSGVTDGLSGEVREGADAPPGTLELKDAGEVDLIPEPAPSA